MISYLCFPDEAEVLGCMDKIDSNNDNVWFWAVVISAFSCIPKAYGDGDKGSDSMYWI